ncbi:hypothetical protein C5Z26_10935 [Lactobacillus sp. CBA3606]|uniref:hypothetical protein n=1 Tax=Lactobacillus sp. CBA3606 TaxID=2099789 RepID=UPI000CFE0589|nr:hypothetical protein [Lactobacillus sp. CBA3606]AVK64592.1 hypothetical protein C5Z26_10935 [Lactobacillus sp. CBA3606]
MQKIRHFLKGSVAELRWLNRQGQHGWQLTQVSGWRYHFSKQPIVAPILTEYVTTPTLTELVAAAQPVATYQFDQLGLAVVYFKAGPQQRTIMTDAPERLIVMRKAREQALNRLNAWAVGIWLLMCFAVILAGQTQLTAALVQRILSGVAVGTVVMLVGIVTGSLTAGRYHRQVRRLIQLTGDDQGTWKPTFHVLFHHQAQMPAVDQLAELGTWQLAMQNKAGDYYFDLQTNLSELEIKNSLLKMIKNQDFTVMSWLGLYPI